MKEVIMQTILNPEQFQKTLKRLTHEVIEAHPHLEDVVLVGILNKGFELATLIQQQIKRFTDVKVQVVPLEIRPFRDDERQDKSVEISQFEVAQKYIVLVDDVLFTGRSVRAALDGIIHLGRPRSIKLCVMVDRGHRELPIRPDMVGKNIPTKLSDRVVVSMDEMTVSIT
jgi:pyrimidine operon attenuation protein / uracil phosphoribosyltransferase